VPKNPVTDAEKLARDWRLGTANIKADIFTTKRDKANPRSFDDVLADAGEPNYPHSGNQRR
jgi:hypothetical protein